MPYFLNCDLGKIDFQNKKIYIKKGKFTTCSSKKPTWKFKFRELKIENQTLIAKKIIFYYKNFPIAYLPKLKIKLSWKGSFQPTNFILPVKVTYYDKDIELYYFLNYKNKPIKAQWGIFFLPLHKDIGIKFKTSYTSFFTFGFNYKYTFFGKDLDTNIYLSKSYKNLNFLSSYNFEKIDYYVSYKLKIYEKENEKKEKKRIYITPRYHINGKKLSNLKISLEFENDCSKIIYHIDPLSKSFGLNFSIKI